MVGMKKKRMKSGKRKEYIKIRKCKGRTKIHRRGEDREAKEEEKEQQQ